MELALLAALAAFGLAARIWILAHPLGVLDSDKAVIGLMARRILDAHRLPTFFWGQNYGGPHEAVAAAAVFAVVGASVVALKVVPMALSALAALLTWRIGRVLLSERAGRWAGVLFWAGPASFVWWSTKASVYWGSLVLALAVVLGLVRLGRRARGGGPGGVAAPRSEAQGDKRRIPLAGGTLLEGADHPERRATRPELAEAGALGLATGLAFWANPQTLYLMVPAYLWYAPRLLARWRSLIPMGAGALVGAAPWIRSNLTHHWLSLHFPQQPDIAGGYLGRLRQFFQVALPMALGARVPYTRAWVLGAVGIVATAGLIVAFVAGSLLLPAPARLLVLVAAVYPFLFAYSPFSWYVDHPRYLLFLAPVLALLLGHLVARRLPRGLLGGIAAAGVAVAACTFGLAVMNSSRGTEPFGPDVHVPSDLTPLTQLLAGYQVRSAFADYWLAYRTTFETGGRTVVSPTYVVRDPTIDAEVRAAPIPDYLFISSSASLPAFTRLCTGLGVGVSLHQSGPFTLAVPATRVLPEQVRPAWQP